MKSFVLCCFLAFLALGHGLQKSYHGYKVLRVQVVSDDQAKEISRFEELGFDFWTEVRVGGSVDIMVAPTQAGFANVLREMGFTFSTMIDDVQTLIEKERSTLSTDKESKITFTAYHTHTEINAYLDQVAASNNDVTTEVIGQSYEGRDMKIVKVCRGGCGNKPAMWIQAGIHAREWIAPATATFLIEQLTNALTTANQDLVNRLDWYILPSVNPDGYEYTWGADRMWRKTRSPNAGSICVGTDPNRNWPFHWNEGGTSNSPCSETYHGPSAKSEIEVANVINYITAHPGQFVFFHDIHSYSQYILLPWGYTATHSPDYDRLFAAATAANGDLFNAHRMTYQVGTIVDLLYVASGSSIDWAKGVAGIDNAISMELRDTGAAGFILPPAQIVGTGEEVWAFHANFARQIIAGQV